MNSSETTSCLYLKRNLLITFRYLKIYMGLKKKDKAFTNSSKQCCDAHCSGYNVTDNTERFFKKKKKCKNQETDTAKEENKPKWRNSFSYVLNVSFQ